MLATRAIMTAIMIMASFAAGFLFFYLLCPFAKTEKRRQLDESATFFIHFVLYIWLGKIILNIQVFIKDPFAVLAYPSNSHAFYLAALFTALHGGFRLKRKSLELGTFLYSVMMPFLFSLFVYTFLQIVLRDGAFSTGADDIIYLGFLVFLLVGSIVLQHKMATKTLGWLLFFGWNAGMLSLSLVFPLTSVFHYLLAPWFFALVLAAGIYFYVIYGRRA